MTFRLWHPTWVAPLLMVFAGAGCMRPYDTPEFIEVGTSEIAFLVPLRDDAEEQTSVDPADFYKEHLVSAKKVQIPHEWIQTGRMSWAGAWKPTHRLIKVDRAPVTREWAADASRGTSTKDQAIWVESADSVGFSTGFTCTARIPNREDGILFLANYPNGSLENVLDKEIRAEVQSRAAEFAAQYTMDDLRSRKNEMLAYIRYGIEDGTKDEMVGVIEFFKERGLEITTLGQFGGFDYENPRIQEAIDRVFEAQQEEEVAKAEKVAQEERNEAIRLAAIGEAEAAKLRAEGLANAAREQARGEAEAIQMVADAKAYEIEKALEDKELYLELKTFEVEMQRLESWDGKYPQYMMTLGKGEANPVMLAPPMVPAAR